MIGVYLNRTGIISLCNSVKNPWLINYNQTFILFQSQEPATRLAILKLRHQLLHGFLGIPEQHPGIFIDEQRIVDTGESWRH